MQFERTHIPGIDSCPFAPSYPPRPPPFLHLPIAWPKYRAKNAIIRARPVISSTCAPRMIVGKRMLFQAGVIRGFASYANIAQGDYQEPYSSLL